MAKAVFKFDAVNLKMAIRRRLREMPHLARAAMNDVGMMVEREAKLRVPVDTGMLTACIRREIVDSPHGAAVGLSFPCPVQFKALAKIRAVVVLPQPRGP